MDQNQYFGGGSLGNTGSPLGSSGPGPHAPSASYSSSSTTRDPHSIKTVMQELVHDMSILIEREIQLLRVELAEKATLVKTGGASLVAAAGLGFFGIQVLVAAMVIGLANVMEWWLAATIVGVVLLAIGAALALVAKKSLTVDNLKPKKSADALSDIGAKLKEKANEFYH